MGLWLAVLLTGTGCITSSAPTGWQEDAAVEARSGYGSWVEGTYRTTDSTRGPVRGELIAVAEDTAYVLGPDSTWHEVPRQGADLRLFAYDPNTWTNGTWGAVGTLSTPSHGLFLIFTGPIWIIWSTATAATASRAPRTAYADDDLERWGALRRFARFPQGLPEGVDPSVLRLKGPPTSGETEGEDA